MKPGIYSIPAADYHQDPCPEPSASSGILRTILEQSPRHAYHQHPKLGIGVPPEDPTKAMDLGSAVHAWLLEGVEAFQAIGAKDYRTKAAREAREAAREAGKIPMLAHRIPEIREMELAAREQLAEHEERPIPFEGGEPEQTIIWRDGGVWCRARPDYLHRDPLVIDDYKSTGLSAEPGAWGRTMWRANMDVQAAFYLRGLAAVTGHSVTDIGQGKLRWRWIVQEVSDPYALSVAGLSPMGLELAWQKVEYALRIWRRCLKSDTWPGYPPRTCYVDPAEWQMAEHEAREAMEEFDV